MKFPSWNDFKEKWNKTEREIKEKITNFKDNHELVVKAIKTSISFLPSPFNTIAQGIYDNYIGTDEEKTAEVLKYFNELQSQGEEHYKQITMRLEGVLSGIDDIKAITAKETTLIKIQETLVARDNILEEDLLILQKQVSDVDIKLDSLVEATAKILRIADIMESQGGNVKLGTVAVQEGNTIYFKSGNTVRDTITAEDLKKLDPISQRLIGTFERSMETNFKIWSEVYPQIPLDPNPVTRAQLELRLEDINGSICKDLKNIIGFLNTLGKNLDDHYMSFRYICKN
jgi:hypothetical protein